MDPGSPTSSLDDVMDQMYEQIGRLKARAAQPPQPHLVHL